MNNLGPNCAVDKFLVLKSARDSNMFRCTNKPKCGKATCLSLVCQHCGCVPKKATEFAPIEDASIDWRKVVSHQTTLLQYPTEPVDKKRGKKDESESASEEKPDWAASIEDLPESMPQPSQEVLVAMREKSTLRAIQYIRRALLRGRETDFRNSGGDIIFLLRNAIFKGRGDVSRMADECVRRMIERWDKLDDILVEEYTDSGELLVSSECLHAKLEMHYRQQWPTLERQIELTKLSLSNKCCDDMLRFDVAQHAQMQALPINYKKEYCRACGQYARENGHASYCEHPKCVDQRIELSSSTAYDSLCEATVWTSIFRQMNIPVMRLTDNDATLEDCLALVKCARPYHSQAKLGRELFNQQCYYITHLLFILSEWGGVNLSCQAASPLRHLFIEELTFLYSNMDVVIRNKDPELVGEFLQSLYILGLRDTDHQMIKGHAFLLQTEKNNAALNGNWVASSQDFRTKYHAAYCGVIGLAPFKYTEGAKMEPQFAPFFQ